MTEPIRWPLYQYHDASLGQLFPRDASGRIMIAGFTLEELAGIATVALAAITLWQVTRRW